MKAKDFLIRIGGIGIWLIWLGILGLAAGRIFGNL